MSLILLLLGCSASGENDLRQWMAQQQNQTRLRVALLTEPKRFQPESYTQFAALAPFSSQKLTQAMKQDSTQSIASGTLIALELARRKESLEAFPLNAMTLVGSLIKGGRPVGLVEVDNLLYQVRPGNYLGQNFGRVMKIVESEVTLREIIQDAAGEWVERTVTLQLQEKSK
jgi:type IV pilus assembly protein PilP